MNKLMVNTINTYCKKFNRDVTDGTAEEILKWSASYLDNIFKDSIKSLSPKVNLKYLGYRYVTPEVEYNSLTNGSINRVIYDISKSDVYAIEFIFDYNGEEIRRLIYLPYASKGNIMYISNTAYFISPVLSDTVISPNYKEVFIRLLKDKLIFKVLSRNFIKNKVREIGNVIYTNILKALPKEVEENNRAITPTALYLVAEMGIRETMSKYSNIENILITTEDKEELYENYTVYESTKIPPKYSKEYGYIPHNLKICLPNTVEPTQFTDNLIYGIIYALDNYPYIAEDLANAYKSNNIEDEKHLWKVLIGKLNYPSNLDHTRLINNIEEHFIVLQGYMDSLIKNKLAETNIHVDTFFDLLALLLKEFNRWVRENKEHSSANNNRYVDILYYLLYDIIICFNKIILSLNKRATKTTPITTKEINKIIINGLSSKKIFNLIKSTEPALCVKLAECTADIMYPRLTSVLEDQSRGIGVKRGNNSTFPPYTKQLRGGDLYLGSLLFLTKSAPTPRFRTNLFLDYNIESGRLNIPKDIEAICNKLDNLLAGKTEEDIDNID